MNTKCTLLIIIALSVISCRKEITPVAASPSQNPTSYELVSETWSGVATNGESILFTYDSTHLLTDYKQIQWGQGGYSITDSGNFPLPGFSDTSYNHLEYSNGRVSKQYVIDKNGGQGYWTYEYNSKGWLVKITTYDLNGQPEDGYTYLYSYNENGQVTDMRQGDASAPSYHDTFEYDSAGNLTKEVDSTLYINPAWVQISEYSNYDNKINFVRALNGYPTTYSTGNNFGVVSSFSPNNYGKVEYYGSIQPGDPFGLLSSSVNAYQYNDQGLPVQIVSGPWTVTLQYQKYK